jgi:RNA polymerase sigma factor (sigma-70 family)
MPLAAADDGPNQYIDHSPSNDTNLDRWTLFHEAIGHLPEEEREVFHLVWYLGADQKTIATLLNCSERTVKYRWRSAREAVRAELEGKPPQP